MKKLVCFLLTVFTVSVYSQWNPNPSVNSRLCPETGSQTGSVVVGDNNSNSICAWVDSRSVSAAKIYVQKYNSSGVAQWQTGGVELSSTQQSASELMAVSDGQGGAIICWKETRAGTVDMYYARKINASGIPQWPSELAMTTPYSASNNDEGGVICSDYFGGAVIRYRRYNNAINKFEIHVQNITSNGLRYWGSSGVVVATSNASVTFTHPQIAPDQTGGVIITYEKDGFVLAQRLNTNGVKQWGVDGISVFGLTPGGKRNPEICMDGSGGAFIIVMDERNMGVSNFDIYAQRVTAAGTRPWGDAGKPVCTADGVQNFCRIEFDKTSGVYIAWNDQRGGLYRPYIQKMDGNGGISFALNGMKINETECGLFDIVAGDNSSVYAVITVSTVYPNFTIGLQKITSGAGFPWGFIPISVCSFNSNKNLSWKNSIAADNSGLVCVWDDLRNANEPKAFGHKIQSSGLTGIQLTSQIPQKYELKQNYPNPFNPQTKIQFSITEQETVKLAVYNSAGKEVSVLVNNILQAGSYEYNFDASGLSTGAYFYRLTAGDFTETKKMMLIK